MAANKQAAAAAIDAFLRAIGRDPDVEPELRGTGLRVADAFADEMCDGYGVDVARLLTSQRVAVTTDLVVIRDMPVTTTCPHHLIPAVGAATVAFAPKTHVVGLGALVRLVDAFAHRLTLQEQIGKHVVAALVEHLDPKWAACRLVLVHGCMTARGERRHGARVETVALAGTSGADVERLAYDLLGVGR